MSPQDNRDEEFAIVAQSLQDLRAGRPIRRDKHRLIRDVQSESKVDFFQRVVRATMSGPQGQSHSNWLKANYGGGKTQALLQLSDELSERTYGNYKVLACMVDLNQHRCNSASGFQLAIFESASVVASTNEVSALAKAAKALLGPDGGENQVTENVVGIGLDIFATLTNFTLPGAGLMAKGGLKWGRRWWSTRRNRLRKLIRRLSLNDPETIELMIRWIQYSVAPSEEKWQFLDGYVQSLSEKGTLVLALSRILKVSNYASIIFLIDQAEKLVGNRTITDLLMSIYDPEGKIGLNVFFVFAGTADVSQLRDEDEYGGFVRRFLDPRQCSSIDVDLAGPDISDKPDNDISRIGGAINNLLSNVPGLPLTRIDTERVITIRRYLESLPPGSVTWPMLWRSTLGDN